MSTKLYISRIRIDGTWVWDEEPRTLKETKRIATFNRCMDGITTQIWPLAEAEELWAKDKQIANA